MHSSEPGSCNRIIGVLFAQTMDLPAELSKTAIISYLCLDKTLSDALNINNLLQ